MANPHELAERLARHDITYDQYQQGLAAYNGAPPVEQTGATVPAPGAASAPPWESQGPTQAPVMPDAFGPSPEIPGLTPNEKDRADIAAGDAANAKLESEAAEDRDQARRRGISLRAGNVSPFADAPPLAPRDDKSPALDPKTLIRPGGQAPNPAGPLAPGAPRPLDAGDEALARFLAPRAPMGGGPAHAMGLSPADRDFGARLHEQAGALTDATNNAVAQSQGAASAFAEQSAALADDSRTGLLLFQQQAADEQKRRSELDAEAKASQQKVDAQLAELQAQGVDPNRYWANMSTGSRIAATIAVGLGGLGAAFNHGPNEALQAIQQHIRDDVDAQRANLEKSIKVAGMRGDAAAKSFDQRRALLEAERESIQTGYTIASNEVARRAAVYGQNADVQQKAAQLTAGLQAGLLEHVDKLNEQLYALNKGAERMVGGGGSGTLDKERAAVIARAQQIRDDAHKLGREMSIADAQREAAAERGLLPAMPGQGGSGEAKVQTGARRSEGDNRQLQAHDAAIANIDHLLELRRKHGGGATRLSFDDRADAEATAARTQEDIVAALGKTNQGLLDRTSHLIPDQPLQLQASGVLGADEIGTRLKAARRMLVEERARLLANPSDPSSPSASEPPGEKEDDE